MYKELFKPNVVGAGLGYMTKNGERYSEGVVVMVTRKLPLAALAEHEIIPREHHGIVTDVMEVGHLVAPRPITAQVVDRTGRIRPAPGGVSIGHYKITAGTLGCVCYDAQTGNTVILSNNHVLAACFDDKTEVLTKKGFKLWEDISDNDIFATLNIETNELEYQQASKLHKYWYEGKLIHFTGKSIDMMVTPNHRMLAKRTYKSGLPKHMKPNPTQMINAEKIFNDMKEHRSVSYEFKADATWNCYSPEMIMLPRAEYIRGKDWNVKEPIPLDSWLRFLGRFIADGNAVCNSANEQKFISIRETNPDEIDTICQTVRECGFNPWPIEKNAVIINSKQLYEILSPLGNSHTKYIPEEIKDLPPDYLQIFLDGYIEGDGTKDKVDQYMLCTASKQLSDDLQEILLKCGFTFTTGIKYGSDYNPNGVYYLIRTKKRPCLRLPKTPEFVEYKGYVYCATVPNGTLFIKRNGRSMWSGNSNDAVIGDRILQPGPHDGGDYDDDYIADLLRFVPIEFSSEPPSCPISEFVAGSANFLARAFGSSHQLKSIKISQAVNKVDAAIAVPLNKKDVTTDILEIPGKVKATQKPTIGMKVRKSGRTTGLTMGEVLIVNATVNVNYGGDKYATFEEQFVTGPMSAGGDSGSLVLSQDELTAVGLLFAGSDQVTINNPIEAVFDLLSLSF